MSAHEGATTKRDDWDRHWDDYADAATLNPAQQLRHRLILSLLALDDRPARVIDFGCGHGDLMAQLHAAHPRAELHGLDVSQVGLEVAGRKVPTAKFIRHNLLVNGDAPPQLQRWATHAICSEVLEHVDDPGHMLIAIHTFLAPKCRLVVTVPGGPMSAFDRHIGHRQHFTSRGLGELLRAAGFDVEKVTGVGFPFFNIYRLVVIRRGQRLVRDVARSDLKTTSTLARIVMRLFGLLFVLGVPESRWGWQIVGVARTSSTPA